MVQTKTSHLGKVSYAIILLGWRYLKKKKKKTFLSTPSSKLTPLHYVYAVNGKWQHTFKAILRDLLVSVSAPSMYFTEQIFYRLHKSIAHWE